MKRGTEKLMRFEAESGRVRAKVLAIQRLWQALMLEKYEDCRELILAAKTNGARPGEIHEVLDLFAATRP